MNRTHVIIHAGHVINYVRILHCFIVRNYVVKLTLESRLSRFCGNARSLSAVVPTASVASVAAGSSAAVSADAAGATATVATTVKSVVKTKAAAEAASAAAPAAAPAAEASVLIPFPFFFHF